MAQTLSSLRTQLIKLTDEVRRLREVFLERPPMVPGSLYTLRRRCGKPNCRCAEGHLHATEVLSYRGGPRARNITVQPEHQPGHGQLNRCTPQTTRRLLPDGD